ncbi:hypothetical protein HHI36_018326 [Cryptolaemus montrouzieri]|uniref:Uncharacterized protein n=1 Tax=Cryptolaemus montrouzieri TaxID=559131 RepID=A0ABD2NZL5_9CUCU
MLQSTKRGVNIGCTVYNIYNHLAATDRTEMDTTPPRSSKHTVSPESEPKTPGDGAEKELEKLKKIRQLVGTHYIKSIVNHRVQKTEHQRTRTVQT